MSVPVRTHVCCVAVFHRSNRWCAAAVQVYGGIQLALTAAAGPLIIAILMHKGKELKGHMDEAKDELKDTNPMASMDLARIEQSED